jgi:hypothetical protein
MPENWTTPCLKCSSRPVLARPARGWTLLLTDSGACFKVVRDGALLLEPLADLDGWSAIAVDGSRRLVVGLYDGMVAVPRDDEWAYHPADAAVLSLASTPWGLAIGDAAGAVTFRDPPGPAVARAVLGEPIVDLAALDEEVVALGARGGLWRLGPPDGGGVPVAPVTPPEALGRPVGLFDAGSPSKAGVFGAERWALLASGARSFRVGIRRFPEGVRAVVPFGGGGDARGDPPLGLLTDSGQVWVVESDLKTVAPVPLPEALGAAVGLASGSTEGLLAWTAGGTALALGRDRSLRPIASGDVALAYAEADQPEHLAIVHWHPERGIQVRLLRPEPAR